MITYLEKIDDISHPQLAGFFEGWPNPPSSSTHLKILRQSDHIVLAFDNEADRVAGFINAVSDGVLSAYIPLLEVLQEYRGRGIGGELVRRMLRQLDGLYMIDLTCDKDKFPFYERFGMRQSTGMMIRNFNRQSGRE